MDKLKYMGDNYLIPMKIGINHLTVVPNNIEEVEDQENESDE